LWPDVASEIAMLHVMGGQAQGAREFRPATYSQLR
jgi:hypothetical protein